MGSNFRLPLPIFFADDFHFNRNRYQAKKDFRSSRAASDSTFKYNNPEIISGLLFYHNLQNLLNLRENYHQELS